MCSVGKDVEDIIKDLVEAAHVSNGILARVSKGLLCSVYISFLPTTSSSLMCSLSPEDGSGALKCPMGFRGKIQLQKMIPMPLGYYALCPDSSFGSVSALQCDNVTMSQCHKANLAFAAN